MCLNVRTHTYLRKSYILMYVSVGLYYSRLMSVYTYSRNFHVRMKSRLTLPNEPDEILFFQCLYHHVGFHSTRGKINNIAQYLPNISLELPQAIMYSPGLPNPFLCLNCLS